MASNKDALAIVVGGGPAPGINGVIAAAAIEAINRGHPVYGIHTGFKRIAAGDRSALVPLSYSDVSAIHGEGGSVLGTSRANPKKDPRMLQQIVELLDAQRIRYLVTIGGDDTVSSAQAVARAARESSKALSVAHVPKTIDNDLPIPTSEATFGFQSAREQGTYIVESLMVDAKTTGRWYFAIAMGRKAGHLALGIGLSAGATLTLIPEEFTHGNEKISLGFLTDVIVGSILKRLVNARGYGVAVLAEGLAEILDPSSIPELQDAERDPHGHIRFAELDTGGIIKRAVRARLQQFGVKDLLVVDKNVGYELRCHPPNAFDREYTRELGFGVVDFLLSGGSEAMIIRDGTKLRPLPFSEIIDSNTERSKVRLVDLTSAAYQVACKYMTRLTEEDLASEEFVARLSEITGISPSDLRRELHQAAVHGQGVRYYE